MEKQKKNLMKCGNVSENKTYVRVFLSFFILIVKTYFCDDDKFNFQTILAFQMCVVNGIFSFKKFSLYAPFTMQALHFNLIYCFKSPFKLHRKS